MIVKVERYEGKESHRFDTIKMEDLPHASLSGHRGVMSSSLSFVLFLKPGEPEIVAAMLLDALGWTHPTQCRCVKCAPVVVPDPDSAVKERRIEDAKEEAAIKAEARSKPDPYEPE